MQRLIQLVRGRGGSAERSNFWRNNAILFVGTMLTSFLNYIYNPILGRVLTTEEFGEAQLIVSIFNQVGLILAAFQLVAVVLVATNKSAKNAVIDDLEKLAMWLSLAIAALMVVAMPVLQSSFKFESGAAFSVLGLSYVAAVTYTFRVAILQAYKQFLAISWISISTAVLKIVASLALVYLLTDGALAAITGVTIAVGLGAWLGARMLHSQSIHSLDLHTMFSPVQKKTVTDVIPLLAWVVLATAYITVLYAIDVVLVKALFDPETAGLYAGIGTVARILFFATLSFAWVLIASTGPNVDVKTNRHYLWRSLGITAAFGGIGVTAFMLIPKTIVGILIGSKFNEYAHLLALAGVLMVLAALVNVIYSYYIAHRRAAPVIASIVLGSCVGSAGIALYNETIEQLLYGLIAAATTSLVVLAISMLYDKSKSRLYG